MNFQLKYFLILLTMYWTLGSKAQLPELKISATNAVKMDATNLERADFFYHTSQYVSAEATYYKALENSAFTNESNLYFGNSLSADNKSALAKEFHNEYSKASGSQVVSQIMDQIYDLGGNQTAQATKSKLANAYGCALYDGKVYLALEGKLFSYALGNDGSLTYLREEFDGLTDMYIGGVAFMSLGKFAVLSIIDLDSKSSQLYWTKRKNNGWSKPKKLPFMTKNANYVFPASNIEGNTLYFSSDMVGGLGGYDIYAVGFNEENGWKTPVNVGPKINTQGNEIMPNVKGEKFYFSTNGYPTLGGYDVFHTDISDWNSFPSNDLATNTQFDDYGVIKISKDIFLKSIFDGSTLSVQLVNIEIAQKLFKGIVVDESNQPISNAIVMLGEKNGSFTTTQSDGSFEISPQGTLTSLVATVFKEDYVVKNLKLEDENSITAVLTKTTPQVIEKEVLRYVETTTTSSSSSYAETMASGTNNEIKTEPIKVVEEITYSNQTFQDNANSVQPDRGLHYIIVGSAKDYSSAYDYWAKWNNSFENLEILEYESNLFRIGFFAGTDENSVLNAYKNAKVKKKDVWILRPSNR